MRPNSGVNEWNDPYEIIETGDAAEIPDDRQQAILEAIITEYETQHTTTPLDANASFRVEELTMVDDTTSTAYEFEVSRFIGGTPARRYTGQVHQTDTGWDVAYDNPQRGLSILDSLRKFLPHTSTE
jgi:hypothetical protein